MSVKTAYKRMQGILNQKVRPAITRDSDSESYREGAIDAWEHALLILQQECPEECDWPKSFKDVL